MLSRTIFFTSLLTVCRYVRGFIDCHFRNLVSGIKGVTLSVVMAAVLGTLLPSLEHHTSVNVLWFDLQILGHYLQCYTDLQSLLICACGSNLLH